MSTALTASSPDLERLRAVLESARSNGATLVASHNAAKRRLPELADELTRALAGGDAEAVTALRAERATVERDLSELPHAVELAATLTEEADRALAIAERPALFAELKARRDELLGALNTFRNLAYRFTEQRRHYRERFFASFTSSERAHGNHQTSPLHEYHAVRLPEAARGVITYLGDFPAASAFTID